MPDPRKTFITQEAPKDPTKPPEGSALGFIWEKMIKRFPGYSYEVFDALSPIKTRDIDWAKDPILGIIPLQIPPLAKGIFYLGREALTGDPGANRRRRRRLQISLEFVKDQREQKLTPEAKAKLRAELDQLYKLDGYQGWQDHELTPRALLEIAGRQYPTWQALYTDLRDTIPGIGELEAIVLLEPDKIPEATDRWVQRFKDEPLDLTVIALGVTKAKLLSKARSLRKKAAQRTAQVSEAQPLITQAEKYEKAAKYVGRANPEEAPIELLGAVTRAVSPPGGRAYNPEVQGTYGTDPETGKPLTTTIRPEDFAEGIRIDKGTLPIAVLSDYDYGAMVEGWVRFYDNKGAVKVSPTEIREDSVAGAARRFLVSKQMILEQRRRHAEDLAEDVGVPSTTTTDPTAAGKRGIEVYQNWQAQQDRNANDIAKQVAKGTTNPHDAGKVAHGHYEDWQLGKKSEFDKEFGEIGEALDQPLRSLTEAPPETPTPDTPTGTRTTAEIVPESVPRKGTRERRIKGNWGNRYTGRYGVDNFDNFIFSHHADGTKNEVYPERLQPRDRSDTQSQLQMQKIGRELDPEDALDDTSSMNDGAALVKRAEQVYTPEEIETLLDDGHDVRGKWVVLSGNGRMAGFAYAIKMPEFRQNAENYVHQLHARAAEYGVTEDIGQSPFEVLYREVTDDLNPDQLLDFVKEANDPSGAGFRSSETASIEAQNIDPDMLQHFATGDYPSLREGLKANPQFVHSFIQRLPENKRKEFYDAGGKNISDAGYERIEKALLVSVFEGEAGTLLSRRFADVSDPGLINLRKAVYAALPELADLKYDFKSGDRQADLDITEDIATAIFKTQKIIEDQASVEFARAQGSLFDDPDYENMLRLLHVVEAGRTDPQKLTDFLKWYADQIKKQPSPTQATLLDDIDAPTKAEILEAGLGENFDAVPEMDELRTKWEQKEAAAPTPEAPKPEAPPQLLARTRAKLEELRAADSKLLSDPDLDKVSQILDSILEDAAKDGLTLHDFDKMRTNFRKRLTGAVQNGEMTPIGSAEISRVFYQTLTEDFYDLVEAEVAINPEAFPPDMIEKIRAAKQDYRTTKVEIEESPAIEYLRKTEDNPAELIDELLKEKGIYTPDQIAILKSTLGNDGWTELQAALLDRFIGEATNPSTGNIYRDKLGKMIDKLNNTHPEKASLLFDRVDMDSRTGSAKISNVDKLKQIATRTDLENSVAAQFLQKAENAPAALIDELLKEKGQFNPDEIKNLKAILGEQGFRELQPGLLGRIYEMAAKRETTPEQITATGLRTVLKQMTGRDKNRLVDLFGKETAEFLEQSALFAERFARAGTWHKGSPTAKLQRLLGTGAGGGGLAMLADTIGLQLMYGGYNLTNLSAPQYVGIAVLTASWGSVAGYNKFIMSEAGRKWLLEGWEARLPGTNITINSGTLNAAADWMTENKFELGFTAHKIGDAARQTDTEKEKQPEPKRTPITPPARNPFAGYGRPEVQ